MKKKFTDVIKCEDCDWKEIIKGKWVLLDTNTVINIIKYSVASFLKAIKGLGITLFTLQPIVLELNRTNNRKKRIERNDFLNNHVQIIDPDVKLIQGTRKIQEEMWLDGYYPEPVDLYLASAINKFSNGKTYLATSNLDDFREPLFEKKGYILLKDEKSVCVISLLIFRQKDQTKERPF